MLTVVLGLGSALGYVMHDFLMVKVVRAVSVWTAMCWSMGVGMLIVVPLALALHGLPDGPAEWRAVAFAVAGGLCEAAALDALADTIAEKHAGLAPRNFADLTVCRTDD